MLDYSLELIGNIISINEQHLTILEKLKLISTEILNYLKLNSIIYYSYKDFLKKEFSLPEQTLLTAVSNKVFLIGEPEKIKIANQYIYNIPIRDSFYIYGVLQISRSTELNFEEEKLLNLLSHQIGNYINTHRINEAINERLENLSFAKEKGKKFNENFFNMHIELLSKLLSSQSKITILKYFSIYLIYNEYFSIENGIYYLNEKESKVFKPCFSFTKNNITGINFEDSLKKIKNLKLNKKFLNSLPIVVNKNELYSNFPNKFIYPIKFNKKILGFFITDKKVYQLKTGLNLLGLSLEYFNKAINIKQLHNRIKEVENKIFQTNISKSYTEIINQISHEIKNPLIAIAGFSKRLVSYLDEKKDIDYDFLKRRIKIILDESLRLENLLHDLIIFNRVDSPEFVKCSLYSIIKKTINLFKPIMEDKNIEIVFHYKKTPFILGDPVQIRQLLYNLILNSYEAIRTSGKIDISLYSGEKNAIIEIKDNGGGISESSMQNIFNPFFTTKIKGSGLGLAIVYKIVKNHNGEIVVKNIKGGVKFTIKLPFGGKDEKNFTN